MSIAGRGRCLAVIPARGGSKRVPNKNIRELFGKPMIAYTAEAAVESDLFAEVVVSTDSEEIAEISRKFGARAPCLRDASLADDYTPVSSVTLDALNRVDADGRRYEYVAQLMPNCPLRTAVDVRDSYHQFVEGSAASQISVARYGWQNPWWAMERNQALELKPMFAT